MPVITVSSQLRLFFLSCGMGMLMAAVYEFFQIIRLIFFKRRLPVFLWDIIYCTVAALSTFSFILAVNKGELRWFMFVGEAVGFILTYSALSKCVTRPVVRALKAVNRCILSVFAFLCRPFKRFWGRFCQKRSPFVKNDKKGNEISN